MAFAFCNYVTLLQSNSTPTSYKFQNFSINEPRRGFDYLPFAITTGAGTRGGDRSSARLVVAANQISVNIAAEAANGNYFLRVETFSLNIETLADSSQISTEVWRVAGYEMDTERVFLNLTSPLDAVRTDAPRRVLSTQLVGALPTSGSLIVS